MRFRDLIDYLDEQFPKELSPSRDNDGVDVCVDYNLEIGRVLVVLDVTFEVIDYAVTNGYNCVISHHPMIYQPLGKLDLSTSASKKAVMLARHNICAAAFHIRLDCVEGGVNDSLLKAAGILKDAEKIELLIAPEDNNLPVGRVVTLKESKEKNLDNFVRDIKKALKKFYKTEFGVDADFHVNCAYKNKIVKKIGVVSGSGMGFEKIAVEMGADTFLTGEGKYHDLLEAYDFLDINIITAGHFETEAVVLPFIKRKIIERFPDAKVDCFVGDNV